MEKTKSEKNIMKNIFFESGFNLSNAQIDQFWLFYELLIQYNDEYDLTRLNNFNDIIIKHFIDSIYLTKLIDISGPLLDIGTGAGFPGIPLKIVLPGVNIILAEPRYKRISFLEIVIKELQLQNIEIYPHMVTEKSFFHINSIITRALELIDDTLTRVGHFIPKDGKIIFMKGPQVEKDISQLSEKNSRDYTLEKDLPYTLPNTKYDRRIIVYKKLLSSFKVTYKILHNQEETKGLAITSLDNNRFKEIKKLVTADGIKKSGNVIISGKYFIKDIIEDSHIIKKDLIIFDGYVEEDEAFNNIIHTFSESRSLLILKKSLFNEIDIFNSESPLLMVKVPEIEAWDFSIDSGCTLLVPFQDPANVGSVIRSAVGFGIKNIIMLKEGAHPYHPKSIRASAGSVFKACIKKGPSINDLAEIVNNKSLPIVSLDKNGKDIKSFNFPDTFLLIPGMEGPGIPDFFKSKSIAIPVDCIESLNAAVAASIALYEWRKRV